MRVVIDTNVLISAIFWTGKPKQLLNRIRHQEITFITSNDLLDELKRILVRQDKPFHLSDNEADQVELWDGKPAERIVNPVVELKNRLN